MTMSEVGSERRRRPSCFLIAPVLAAMLLAACGGTADGGEAGPPGSTGGASSSRSASVTPAEASPTTTDAGVGSDGGGGAGPFPCSLIDPTAVAGLVAQPELDDAGAARLNAPFCVWRSAVEDGDLLRFEWDTNSQVAKSAKLLGTAVGDLGDEAFYQQTPMNVGSALDRHVVQTRLFVTLGDELILFLLRSENAVIPNDLIALAHTVVEGCARTGCARPPRATSAAPAVPAGTTSSCTLLTTDEIAGAGAKASDGVLTGSDGLGCQWAAPGEKRGGVYVYKRADFTAYERLGGPYKQVEGITWADKVAVIPEQVALQKGDAVYSVICARPCDLGKEQLIGLAEKVAARL